MTEGSTQIRYDPHIVRPADYEMDVIAAIADGHAPGNDFQDQFHNDALDDVSSDNASSCPSTPREVTRPLDYIARLQPRGDAHALMEVIYNVMDVVENLWEEGHTELVQRLANALVNTPAADTEAQAMAFAALRSLVRDYRQGEVQADIPPYWQAWVAEAFRLVAREGGFRVCHAAPTEDNVETEEDSLMQFQNLNPTVRAVRPHRPEPWQAALHRMRQFPSRIRRRILKLMEEWLERQVMRLGHPLAEVSMMLRDSRNVLCMEPLQGEEETVSQRAAGDLQGRLSRYLDECHEHREGARLQNMLDMSLDMAQHYDELDFDQLPLGREERDRQDFEETQLQYLVNQEARLWLQGEASSRTMMASQLLQALRNQIGSECRHLRRLFIALQGLLLLGHHAERDSSAAASSAEVPGEEWVSGAVDNLVMLASQDHGQASAEVGWFEEMMRLRRWLASDRFLDVSDHNDDVELDHEEAEETVAPDANSKPRQDAVPVDEDVIPSNVAEPDASSLVQNRPPWKQDGHRQRSRSRRGRGRPTTAHQERADRETNAHRPWRNAGGEVGRTTASRVVSAAAARTRARHPAVIRTNEGDCNLGVHAWHVLLNMVSALEAPVEPEYGLSPEQHANIRATFSDMGTTEIAHMVGSFLRFVAILSHDVADALEEAIENNEPPERPEADDAEFMQRFLKKADEDKSSSKGGETESMGSTVPVFGSAVEMQISTVVSALEVMPTHTAERRVMGLLQRLNLQYRLQEVGTRAMIPQEVLLVESALVTFTDGVEVDYLANMVGQDKEFVDYWWRVLGRHLPRGTLGEDAPSGSASWDTYLVPSKATLPAPARFSKPLRSTQLDVDELDGSQDEVMLATRLDEHEKQSDARGVPQPEQGPQQVELTSEEHLRELRDAARRYQRWEDDVVEQAMCRKKPRQAQDRIRVVLCGEICDQGSSSTSQGQTSTWSLRPGETIRLTMSMSKDIDRDDVHRAGETIQGQHRDSAGLHQCRENTDALDREKGNEGADGGY